MAVHHTFVRLLVPLLAAVTLGATSASAAAPSPRRVHAKHSVRVMVPAQPDSLDGTLVAPGGCGTRCMDQAKSPSVLDWVKAQLQRLVGPAPSLGRAAAERAVGFVLQGDWNRSRAGPGRRTRFPRPRGEPCNCLVAT